MSKSTVHAAFLLSRCFIVCVLSQPVVYLPDYGTILGNEYSDYSEYLGIPYAKAPIPENNLRWENTVKMDNWESNGSYAATSYGSSCLQPNFDESANVSISVAGSENCLYMNIWVPNDHDTDVASSTTSTSSTDDDYNSSRRKRRRNSGGHGSGNNGKGSNKGDDDSDDEDSNWNSGLSVMIWFYGGSYLFGGAGSFYDGSKIASSNNVIVVSFNYRLGALGFLYDDTLGFSGNYGYYDQLFAVNWVYDNIEYFGGNKNDIILFGQSAGAQSVANMLLSYNAPSQTDISVKGKFRGAIMQSTPFSVRQRTPETWPQVPLKKIYIFGLYKHTFLDFLDSKICKDKILSILE